MDGLHARNHAEIAEARNIPGVNMLGMFDAPTLMFPPQDVPGTGLEHLQGFSIRAVASAHAHI